RLLRNRFLHLHHEVLVLAAPRQLSSLRVGRFLLTEVKQGDPFSRLVEDAPEKSPPFGLGGLAAALSFDGGLLLFCFPLLALGSFGTGCFSERFRRFGFGS